jgi:hypothetical protein
MTIRRTEEVPGGFEGRAGGSKGNPTPTAKSTALHFKRYPLGDVDIYRLEVVEPQ